MKKTITSKIIVSYISLILIALIFNGILFSIISTRYMENKAKKNLMNDVQDIASQIDIEMDKGNEITEGTIAKILQKIYKNRLLTTDLRVAVISKDFRVILPRVGYDAMLFRTEVLPDLKAQLYGGKKLYVNIKFNGVYHIGAVFEAKKSWVILYTPIGMIKQLKAGIIVALIFSIIFTGIIAVVFGIIIARSITKPIISLRDAARKISKRDFNVKARISSGDELQELGDTIDAMTDELENYVMSQKTFLQNASHELKTPLMSIQGYAEGIKDGVFTNDSQALDIIIDESKRLKRIVDDIIYLSKLETTEEFYKFENNLLNTVIEASIDKINSIAVKENIQVIYSSVNDCLIYMDLDKLVQAFINILGNCIRYARSTVTIVLDLYDDYAQICITDDGEGFNEVEKDNLFKRFYKGKKGNTGLGLAITKVIIEKHGGKIEADNNHSGGAKFIISLPV